MVDEWLSEEEEEKNRLLEVKLADLNLHSEQRDIETERQLYLLIDRMPLLNSVDLI